MTYATPGKHAFPFTFNVAVFSVACAYNRPLLTSNCTFPLGPILTFSVTSYFDDDDDEDDVVDVDVTTIFGGDDDDDDDDA